MKRTYSTILFCASALLMGTAQAQTVYLLDFNTTSSDSLPGGASAWNQFAAPSNVTGIIADTNGSTAGGITVSQTGMNYSGASGADVFNNPTGGPSWVTTDGSLGDTGAAADGFFTAVNGINSMELTFSGLNAGSVVSLDLWASRDASNPSTVTGYYSYSLDGGTTWQGFNVLEKDGTASTANGWDTNDTLSQVFGAETDAFDNARYMNIDNIVLTGDSLIVRAEDPADKRFVMLNAARLTIIPEPSTYAIAFGLLALCGAMLRRRKQP